MSERNTTQDCPSSASIHPFPGISCPVSAKRITEACDSSSSQKCPPLEPSNGPEFFTDTLVMCQYHQICLVFATLPVQQHILLSLSGGHLKGDAIHWHPKGSQASMNRSLDLVPPRFLMYVNVVVLCAIRINAFSQFPSKI